MLQRGAALAGQGDAQVHPRRAAAAAGRQPADEQAHHLAAVRRAAGRGSSRPGGQQRRQRYCRPRGGHQVGAANDGMRACCFLGVVSGSGAIMLGAWAVVLVAVLACMTAALQLSSTFDCFEHQTSQHFERQVEANATI